MDNNHHQQQHNSNHHHRQQQLEWIGAAEQPQQELEPNGCSSTRIIQYASGYRFCPSDEEVIRYYLRRKIDNLPLPFHEIPTIELNKHSPETLKKEYKWSKLFPENEMFVFTSRSRKYPKGSRPDRTAQKGYWKPTGVEKCITYDGQPIGYRKQLDFYRGNQKNGQRTDWKMHEYRLDQVGPQPRVNPNGEMDKQLDRCVLCKIYLSSRGKGGGGDGDGDGSEEETAESFTNTDDSSLALEETNKVFVQNQSNNLVIPFPGTSIATTFTCSSTYEPNSIVQTYGNNTPCFSDQEQAGNNSFINANNHGRQTVQTNEAAVMQIQNNNLVSSSTSTSHAFEWAVACNPTTFDHNSSFNNQSSRKRIRGEHAWDSNIMNGNHDYGQTSQTSEAVMQNLANPAPSTSHVFGWQVTYNNPSNDQNSSFFHDQSAWMLDQNGSSINHQQSSWKRDCKKENAAAWDFDVNANNHGQCNLQTIDGVVQNQNNNLVSMDPSAWPSRSSSQMFDQNSSLFVESLPNSFQVFDHEDTHSLMDLSPSVNGNFFPARENFPPEPNYYQIMAASDFSDANYMYMTPINSGDTDDQVDRFDTVKDSKQTSEFKDPYRRNNDE